MEPDSPLSPTVQRLLTCLLVAGLVLLWLLDMASSDPGDWPFRPVVLAFGTLTALALLLTQHRRHRNRRR